MDVHQASITAAILHGDDIWPQMVRLPGDLNAARRLFHRLAEKGVSRACHEASGAGDVLQRALSDDGFHLARRFRSGHLTAVAVPDVDQEAVRHLLRAHLFNRRQITRAKHRIVGILRTGGYHFPSPSPAGPSSIALGWPSCRGS